MRTIRALLAVGLLLLAPGMALAQKQGGVLRVYHRDAPGGMTIHGLGPISSRMTETCCGVLSFITPRCQAERKKATHHGNFRVPKWGGCLRSTRHCDRRT